MSSRSDGLHVLDVAEIDREHQELHLRVEALVHAIRRGSSRDEVGRTLGYLQKYADTHLTGEDALMRQVGFPDLERHRAEHEDFLRTLAALKAEHEAAGPSPSLILRVSTCIRSWVRDHAFRADRQLLEYLRARAAAS